MRSFCLLDTSYQWQRRDGSDWVPVDGATDDALQVSAKGLSVGAHTYRCEVTATRGVKTKTLDSNESVVTAVSYTHLQVL